MPQDNPENSTPPLTFPQMLEARMQFDPDLLQEMLDFNTGLLDRATDPDEIAELTDSGQYLSELLQRLEF